MTFSPQVEEKKVPRQKADLARRGVRVVAALLAGILLFAADWVFLGITAAGQRPHPAMSVPVIAVAAKKGDIPVYVTGLGTVTALYTATVLTQVNGQVVKVPFKEGDIVRKGALLAQIDPAAYEATLLQAQGQLARDKALLAQAKTNFTRYDILVKQNSISRQQRDDQLFLVHQYEGTVKLDEGLVKSAAINLGYTRITAPFTGRIGLRFVDPGNIVHTTDTNGIAVITQDRPITVIFPVAEENLPAIMKKLNAGESLAVEALDRAQNRLIATGRLLTADNQIDTTTGTVRLKAIFKNGDNTLFPNQFVNARVLMETLRGVTVVPSAAVQRSPEGTFVYVVNKDETVSVRKVTLGPSQKDTQSIEKGLSPGESVVVEGAEKLREGSKVRVQTPGAKNSGKKS
ncbi:MAG: MdtA/MuxA family multidrug efflux RND transporter periplasmic adaptor subunit [Syntrophobacteraceae bacterium]|nr:MdtA/MuxA family multidrug efflux RND transporter periplasmic adaptor subunit [Syntrophobacteraceae bacterium]